MATVTRRQVDHNNSQGNRNLNRALEIYMADTIQEMIEAEIELYKNFENVLDGVEAQYSSEVQLLSVFKKELEDKKRSLLRSSVSEPVSHLMLEKYGLPKQSVFGVHQ